MSAELRIHDVVAVRAVATSYVKPTSPRFTTLEIVVTDGHGVETEFCAFMSGEAESLATYVAEGIMAALRRRDEDLARGLALDEVLF